MSEYYYVLAEDDERECAYDALPHPNPVRREKLMRRKYGKNFRVIFEAPLSQSLSDFLESTDGVQEELFWFEPEQFHTVLKNIVQEGRRLMILQMSHRERWCDWLLRGSPVCEYASNTPAELYDELIEQSVVEILQDVQGEEFISLRTATARKLVAGLLYETGWDFVADLEEKSPWN